MITTNLQLDGECLRPWVAGEQDGFLCLVLPVGGELAEVRMRRQEVENYAMPPEDARPLTVDEAAEVVFRMGITVIAAQKPAAKGGAR